jgi:flagellar protein FlaG
MGPVRHFAGRGILVNGVIMDIQPIGSALLQSAQLASQTIASTSTRPVATPDRAVDPSPQPSAEQLTQAVAGINQVMQKLAPGLEFSIDQESNRTIVKVVDQQTKELIRQMPSAETLEIAKALDRVQGLLISLRA